MLDGIGFKPHVGIHSMLPLAVCGDTTTMRRLDTQKVRHFKIFLLVVHP
jgi:hypothetical protein